MKTSRSILIITSILVLNCYAVFAGPGPSEDFGWKAGVSRTVITPGQSMWMAGFAARTKPSEGTLHDLWAKALVLEDEEGQRAVLLSFDLSGMPKLMSDRLRNQLADKFQLSKAQILLNFSHTHSGPVLRDYLYHVYPLEASEREKIELYSSKLEGQVINLVGEALNSLEPVQLYAENGVARFQVNRRNNSESTLTPQSELNGPNDYAVPVIKVIKKTGDLLAVAFGYACHPTVLSENKWSGDYVGYAQIALEKAYPGVTALFFQGAGGDQNPLPRRSVALAEQYGRELAVAVERVLKEEMKPLSPEMSVSYAEVDLPINRPPSKKRLWKMVQESKGHYQRWAKILYNTIEQGKPMASSYPFPLQVWKMGDQRIISLGGEPVIDYAIGLKNLYGRDTFVFGYSNDVMAYIPTTRVLGEGGYEGATSQMAFGMPGTWKASIEMLIFKEIEKLVKEMDFSP